MKSILYEPVEKYLYSLLPQSDPALARMEEEAGREHIPIVGPAVGRLLYQLAQISGAKTVFEAGSAIGYSTIWWAHALGPDGRVIYTDSDPKNAARASRNFEEAGVASRVRIETGDALDILSRQPNESFDIIFNDVDKEQYPRVLPLAIPRLKHGGLFITDNVLWSGRAAQPESERDNATRAIVEFNNALYASSQFFTTIIPLRDGVAVARKR
ncbi:MAG: O-methyltransferase [Acidobacteriaceae bacterium]|nr:O-methyltransferase [Acidobacteriaceae bacterium]MBV9499184.1 O-methyltransferase [Acidobacteriaceae bacterium]